MIEIVRGKIDDKRQWLRLTPALIEALEGLAAAEGTSLEALLVDLINEALANRLRRRS